MKHLFVSLSLFFTLLTLQAQEGDFFVSHFTPTFNQENQVYFDIMFTASDEMIVANRAGIVKYDGNNWNLIPTPSSALSIALDGEMNVYVACIDNFGMIEIIDGQYRFVSLAAADNLNITKQVVHQNGTIYFLQGFAIYAYNVKEKTIRVITAGESSAELIKMSVLDGQVWVETETDSYVVEEELIQKERILPDGSLVLESAVHQETNRKIFFSADGNAFLYDKSFFPLEALSGKEITGLAWVSDQLITASTLSEGIFFYDFQKNTIVGESNSRNGLSDNEIFAIAADNSKGLWVANAFGFNRIAPLLPIRSFNHYPGIKGNLTTAAYHQDTWYVATSFGTYYFDKEDHYKSYVYYVPRGNTAIPKKQQVVETKPETAPSQEEAEVEEELAQTGESQEDTKGFGKKLSKLFNKSKREDKDEATIHSPEGEQKQEGGKFNITNLFRKKENEGSLAKGKENAQQITKIKQKEEGEAQIEYDRKVRRELVATKYLFRKVEGVNDKIKKIISYGDKLIVVTPAGLIEIEKNVGTEIYQEPVRYAFHPPGTNEIWVSSKTGRIIKIEERNGIWRETQLLETPGDVVLSVYQDKKGILWMVGAGNLYEVETIDRKAQIVNIYAIDNHFFDQIRITEINNALYFINTLGIFRLDKESERILMDEELMKMTGPPMRHLIQSDGRVWIHNDTNWVRIEPNGSITEFNYLKLFTEMTFIEQIGDELWLIDNHESLYKFTPQVNDSIPTTQMFFRKFEDANGIIKRSKKMFKIDYERNSVHVEMSRPDYLGLLNIEYQYRLVGLQDEWSPWLRNNRLSFNYLPANQYILEVRSRDAFGRLQLSEPVYFRIDPPYWQTIWFNGLQVLFFTGLVFLVSRLNRKSNDNPKLTLLTNILTIVTIVMIIELLQNLAQNYVGDLGSPVMAFALDVIVALLIFPIELVLKKVVIGGNQAARRLLI